MLASRYDSNQPSKASLINETCSMNESINRFVRSLPENEKRKIYEVFARNQNAYHLSYRARIRGYEGPVQYQSIPHQSIELTNGTRRKKLSIKSEILYLLLSKIASQSSD